MPYFKQEILESSEALGGLDTKEYKDALKKTAHGLRVEPSTSSSKNFSWTQSADLPAGPPGV